MSTRSTWFVTCDICGNSDGWSHNGKTARHEAREHGWIRRRNKEGRLVDICRQCIERAEEWAKAPAIEFAPEVQP